MLTSKKPKVQIGHLRRACYDDVEEIGKYLNPLNLSMFNCTPLDIKQMIKTCVLSLVQLDTEDKVAGFVALSDHPRVPHMHPSAWEDYVSMRYKLIDLNSRNTLFVHMICWNAEAGPKVVATSMLRSVFMHDLYLHHICMINQKPAIMHLDAEDRTVENMFKMTTPIPGIRGVPMSSLPGFMTLYRHDISPRLRIRRAVEEDNDDIVPIVDAQSERLRELYGDFYISELVARHPESNRVLLVAEHNELAVGIMVLNSQINLEILQENFELAPYSGFRSQMPEMYQPPSSRSEVVHAVLPPDDNGSLREPEEILREDDTLLACKLVPPTETQSASRSEQMHVSRVSFEPESSISITPNLAEKRNTTAARWRYLSMLGSDELEFDIINIERHLLDVPGNLSTSSYCFEDVDELDSEEIEPFEEIMKKNPSYEFHFGPRKQSITRDPKFSISHRPKIINFCGKPNAFIIELFAMHPDIDERHGFDILEVAFEMFADRSYAILALPTQHPPMPLLEHFTLVTPQQYKSKMITQSLYAAHRNAVRGKISLRPAEACDALTIDHLVQYSPRPATQVNTCHHSLTSREIQTFVVLNEKKPVGLIITEPIREEGIRCRYKFTGGDIVDGVLVGSLTDALLTPTLLPHGRWIMREILRLTEYDELFWTSQLQVPIRSMISLTECMVPAMPRQPNPDFSQPVKRHMVDTVSQSEVGAWHINRPMTSLPKVDINHNIVVVGASTTALAFIETLLFGPSAAYLTFTNITLVSTHGLPVFKDNDIYGSEFLLPLRSKFTEDYFNAVPIAYYMDIVEGILVEIDRKKKCIYLQDGMKKHYDDLYLMCGLQFQHPHHLREELQRERKFEAGMPCRHSPMDDPEYTPDRLPLAPPTPFNMFIINDFNDAARAISGLTALDLGSSKGMTSYSSGVCEDGYLPGYIVVYGECIEALCCVNALLKMNTLMHRICYVEPFPSAGQSLRVQHFNDEVVDLRVRAGLDNDNVIVLSGYTLTNWTFSNDLKIKSVQLLSQFHAFELQCIALFYYGEKSVDVHAFAGCIFALTLLLSQFHAFELQCIALFYYGEKSVDVHAFAAMNSCGLVYDGALVITPQFGTNDPNIFAAGPITRYSRQLHSDRYLHKYYSSEDVGKSLGELVLSRLDPFVARQEASKNTAPAFTSTITGQLSSQSTVTYSTATSRTGNTARQRFIPQSVPKFKSPLICSCSLPGGLHYLVVRKPGVMVPAGMALSIQGQNHTCVTDKDGNYFCVRLDSNHIIYEMTCLSKVPFRWKLLTKLYGRHGKIMDQFFIKYMAGLIEDLYEYFNSAWLTALYRDDFNDLIDDVHNCDVIYKDNNLGTMKEIITKLTEICRDTKTLRARLVDTLKVCEKPIADLLIEWLKERNLPMYAIAGKACSA